MYHFLCFLIPADTMFRSSLRYCIKYTTGFLWWWRSWNACCTSCFRCSGNYDVIIIPASNILIHNNLSFHFHLWWLFDVHHTQRQYRTWHESVCSVSYWIPLVNFVFLYHSTGSRWFLRRFFSQQRRFRWGSDESFRKIRHQVRGCIYSLSFVVNNLHITDLPS